MEVITSEFLKTSYVNHSCAVFEGFYESNLFNSDTLYYLTENDRGETTIDNEGNEVSILKDNEEYDFTGDNYKKFKLAVCEFAVSKLEELATEYKSDEELVLKNFKLHGMSSPKYYNFETDKLHIDMEVNIRALEEYCFNTNKDNFNKYLHDNFTSYDGFISYIDNNIDDFRFTYNRVGDIQDRIDSVQGDVMIEYYLLTMIYETTDLSTVISLYEDEYRYHMDVADYARDCLWDHVEPVKV